MTEAVAEVEVSKEAQKAIDDLLKLSEEDRGVVFMKVLEKTTVLGALGLVKLCEDQWGVSAAAPAAVMAGPAGDAGADEEEEQTAFDVILINAGQKKIAVIKEVRALTGLSLKDAKAVVDAAPKALKEKVDKEEAEKIRAQIEAAGGVVEVK